MSSIRKKFMVELIKLHSPLSNVDVEDVASALGISFLEAEAVAGGLQEEGCINTVGGGGNIAPTGKGRMLAADPNWEKESMVKGTQEKIETVQKAAADLRKKALDAGLAEPFVCFVLDTDGGIFLLDAPPLADTSSCPVLSWHSNLFFVFICSQPSSVFMQATVRL